MFAASTLTRCLIMVYMGVTFGTSILGKFFDCSAGTNFIARLVANSVTITEKLLLIRQIETLM